MASRLRVRTNWNTVEVTSEPYVVMTFRGYTAAIEVLDVETNEPYELLIGGIKSLADGIEPIREANGGLFTGIRIRIKKKSDERFAPYVVESAGTLSSQEDFTGVTESHKSKFEDRMSSEDKLWERISSKHGVQDLQIR